MDTRHRFSLNVWSNAGLLVAQTMLGLWYAPFLVHRLGPAVYGLIPLANSIAAYMSVLETSVRGSLSRELSRSRAAGADTSGSVVYATALWAAVGLGFILLPVAIGLALLAPSIFSVPASADQAARILFGAVLVMYLVGIVRSVMTTVPFVLNRFDLQNITPISEIVVRVAVIVGAFVFISPRLEWVALGLVASGLSATVVAALVNRRVAPDISSSFKRFSRSTLSMMWATSSWMMINQMGSLLFLSIDVIVVNLVLGATAAGLYGSVLIWSTFLRSLAAAVSSAVTPVVLKRHAEGEKDRVSLIMGDSVKLLGLAIAIAVGVVAGLSPALIGAWLGSEYVFLWPVLTAQVFHLAVNLAVLPLFSAQLAAGRVKVPGIVTLASGVVNVSLAYSMAHLGRNGIGVALAGALVLTAKNAGFTTIYTARIQGLQWWTYVRALLPGFVATVLIGVGARGLLQIIHADSLWSVATLGVAVGLLSVGAIYVFALGRRQRDIVSSLLLPRLRG